MSINDTYFTAVMTDSNFLKQGKIDFSIERTKEDVAENQALEAEQQEEQNKYEQDLAAYDEAKRQEEERNRPLTAGDYLTEVPKALYLGARDTVASFITLPEQVYDLFSGNMTKEFEETGTYDPTWDNWMINDENPMETRTWWGGLIRGVTHVGTLLAATYATGGLGGLGKTSAVAKGSMKGLHLVNKANRTYRIARLASKKLKILPKLKVLPGRSGGLRALTGHDLLKGSLSGAYFDAVSITSLENNISGMIKDHNGWMDTPLATGDTDHPMMKKFKNIAEGLFLGPVVDGVFQYVGAGRKYIFKNFDQPGKPITGEGTIEEGLGNARDESVRDQNLEEGMKQLEIPGFNAFKNEPISQTHQGNSTSLDSLESASEGLQRVNKEFGSEDGIPGSVLSTSQLFGMMKSSNMTRKEIMNVLKRGVSEDYFRQMDETAARQGIKKSEFYAQHAAFAKEVYEGRMVTDISPNDFWKAITDQKISAKFDKESGLNLKGLGLEDLEMTHPAMAHTIDIVNGTLLGEMKALGVTGREIGDLLDLRAPQGPAEQLMAKWVTGIRLRAIQKAETSQLFRDLNARVSDGTLSKMDRRKLIDDAVEERVKQSIDAWRIAFEVSPEHGGDDLFKSIFEAVSMAKGIHNLDDLDQWMRLNLKGGSWKGDKKKMGVLIREMGSMYSHSVLSGPKTPVRAILGTASATFTRPMALAMGATIRGDWLQARQGLAALNAMRETLPEAFQLFKTKLNAYWAGELRGKNTRFFEHSKRDEQWNMFGHWAQTRGKVGDKALYRMANMARKANDSKWLTYSTKIMQATDDAFGLIIGRARAREKAFLKAAEKLPDSNFVDFDAKFFKEMEDEFQANIFDGDGNLTDEMAKYSKKEATLTQDLEGFAKKLENAFSTTPWARPFFLFAKTGVNGLNLTAKHTPVFNLLVDEYRTIAGTPLTGDLTGLNKYGIYNVSDLRTAKAVQEGRVAMGGLVMTMASMAYLTGGLHGNGPTDRKQRRAWQSMGWKPRTIKIGPTWVSYDAFEPFNNILATIADIGDHMDLMGEEWAEDNFLKLSLAIAGSLTSKSYLAGIQSFVDLFSGNPGQQNRIIASLINNQIPLSSLRNEIGKVLNPYTKELQSGILDSIANRNLYAFDRPVKYDILTGDPIKEHNFITRMWNAFSPVQFNLDYSPGRQMLFDSKYDLMKLGYTAPDGTDLKDNAEVRSLFQKALGDLNLEETFNNLAQQENIQISIAQMNYHNANGMKWRDPKDYPHYKIIHDIFQRAKNQAWAQIMQNEEVIKLINKERERKALNYRTNQETVNEILGIRK